MPPRTEYRLTSLADTSAIELAYLNLTRIVGAQIFEQMVEQPAMGGTNTAGLYYANYMPDEEGLYVSQVIRLLCSALSYSL